MPKTILDFYEHDPFNSLRKRFLLIKEAIIHFKIKVNILMMGEIERELQQKKRLQFRQSHWRTS